MNLGEKKREKKQHLLYINAIIRMNLGEKDTEKKIGDRMPQTVGKFKIDILALYQLSY
jgi:hypothetical protein